MGRKKAHTPEEIVAKLRQVEVLTAPGSTWTVTGRFRRRTARKSLICLGRG